MHTGRRHFVHAGLYLGHRLYYPGSGNTPDRLSLCTLFDGTYYLTQSGTPDKPIVIKAAGDGEVIFDGDGAYNLFNLRAASYNHFEGITFRNADVAFLLGTKSGGALRHVNASAGLLVYQNTFIGEARVGPTSNQHFLNNLILGNDSAAPIFAYTTFTSYSSSDYNGFRPNAGAPHAFEWGGPPPGVLADYKANPVGKAFKTLREYSDATGSGHAQRARGLHHVPQGRDSVMLGIARPASMAVAPGLRRKA